MTSLNYHTIQNLPSTTRDQLKRLTKVSIHNFTEHMLPPLKKDPRQRSYNETVTMIKTTGYLAFFKKIRASRVNREKQIHEKCCKQLRHFFAKKGDTVITIDEIPLKFYIIVKGSVLVFKKRDRKTMWIDETLFKKVTEALTNSGFDSNYYNFTLDSVQKLGFNDRESNHILTNWLKSKKKNSILILKLRKENWSIKKGF